MRLTSPVWCRKCVAAHPEGQHLKKPHTELNEASLASLAHAVRTVPSVTIKPTHVRRSQPQEIKPRPASAASAVVPARPKSFTPAVKKLAPIPARPSTASPTNASSVAAGILEAARSTELKGPIAVVLEAEKDKAGLAHKRKIKAAQMRRYRAGVKKRKMEAAKAAKAATKGKKK